MQTGANIIKFMSVIYGFTGWVALDDEMVVKLHLQENGLIAA